MQINGAMNSIYQLSSKNDQYTQKSQEGVNFANVLPPNRNNQQTNSENSFANKLPSSSSTTSTDSVYTSSSIEELEIYFDEKLAELTSSGNDKSSILELRDAIRTAAENKNDDSPSLPTVLDHPYGGKALTNVHLSFGEEIKGELLSFGDEIKVELGNFTEYLTNLKLRSDINSNANSGTETLAAENIKAYKNNYVPSGDDLALQQLADRIDPTNMTRLEAREISSSLGFSNQLKIDNAFLLQSMVLVNDNGNLRNATETDDIMNERFNMFDAINESIQFHKNHGLSTNHLEEGLEQLEQLKMYRENPRINLYT